jgi:hypothetical protein
MKHKGAPTVQVIATSRRLVGIREHSMRWREAGSDTLLHSHLVTHLSCISISFVTEIATFISSYMSGLSLRLASR